MSQVVFPSDVGDLFGLHGLQLWTVGDTMTQTTAKCAAPLSCGCSKKKKMSKNRERKKKAAGKDGDVKAFFCETTHLRCQAWSRLRSGAPGALEEPSVWPRSAGL